MEHAEIKRRADLIITKLLGVNEEQLLPQASFRDDLGADSLDSVELSMSLEEEFGITIGDEELTKINTVKSVYDIIAEKTK